MDRELSKRAKNSRRSKSQRYTNQSLLRRFNAHNGGGARMKCDLCNGVGWIDTFNTKKEVQEIQKCDDCNIYQTDKEAQEQTQ